MPDKIRIVQWITGVFDSFLATVYHSALCSIQVSVVFGLKVTQKLIQQDLGGRRHISSTIFSLLLLVSKKRDKIHYFRTKFPPIEGKMRVVNFDLFEMIIGIKTLFLDQLIFSCLFQIFPHHYLYQFIKGNPWSPS